MVYNNQSGLKPRKPQPEGNQSTPSSSTPPSPAPQQPQASGPVAAGASALPLRRRQPAAAAPAAPAPAPRPRISAATSLPGSRPIERKGFARLVANRPLLTAAAIAVGVVPVVALGTIAYQFAAQGVEQTIRTKQQASALETSNLLDSIVVDSVRNNTEAISLLGILRNPDVIENTTLQWKEDLLARFLDRGFDSVVTTDLEGQRNLNVGASVQRNLAQIGPFMSANDAGGVVVTPPLDIDGSGLAIYAATPIANFETGQQTGTLITRTPASGINEQFNTNTDFLTENLEGFGDALAYAVDAQDTVFAGVESDRIGIRFDELFSCPTAFSGTTLQSEACRFTGDGQDYLVTYSPLVSEGSEDLGLGTYVAQPIATLFAPQSNLFYTFLVGIGGAATLITILAVLLAQLLNRQQFAAEEQREQREVIQTQVLTLLTDMDGASQGDLTVRADVSTGEIGTVADFFNSIVESLRTIVTQVKAAAGEVNTSLGEDEISVRLLAQESLKQAEETTRTLNSVEKMTESIQAVAESARKAADVTQTVATTAEAGGAVMDRTVYSIVNLRETVAETAKKVKRLGESSQQISKVVSLINEIALQTNLLAINASIEAARAGEEGRGFAVVAEEVGKLAAQSATATKDIEEIVQAIQLETNEVVEAMEVGTSQVVEGTQLVEETKQSLEKLFEASGQIDELVQSITTATVDQTKTSRQVSELMKEIARISEQTSQSSRQVSDSLQKTVTIADDLEESVRAFKIGA